MLFKMADKDNSGTLTLEEIRDVLEDIFIRYPQVELYMKNMHMLDIEDSKKLSHVDSQVKSAPATAQVLSVSIGITNIYRTLMIVNNQMINIC
jgi:NADH:ubiquinone reductase (non-electrogenic)